MSKNHAITLVIRHPSGLHARPAAKFVQLAARFPCQITVQKVNSSKPAVNAKSALSVLTLGVNMGDEITITAEGERAEEAIAALTELVDSNFGESVASNLEMRK